jgi:hypothetical protein
MRRYEVLVKDQTNMSHYDCFNMLFEYSLDGLKNARAYACCIESNQKHLKAEVRIVTYIDGRKI